MASFDSSQLPPGFSAAPPGGAGGDGGPSREEKQAERDDQRQMMLTIMLTPAARDRLNRVAMVRPDNARLIEAHLFKMLKSKGPPADKIDESSLTGLLEQVTAAVEGKTGAAKKVVIMRKKRADDSDNDDDL